MHAYMLCYRTEEWSGGGWNRRKLVNRYFTKRNTIEKYISRIQPDASRSVAQDSTNLSLLEPQCVINRYVIEWA